VAPLVRLAEALGAPHWDQWHSHVNFPQDHPLHGGYDPAPYLAEADAIVAVESDVPWIPKLAAPRPEAKVIQVAMDPLFSRYPIRGFPADLALAGTTRLTLAALAEAIVAARPDSAQVAARRQRWEADHSRRRAAWEGAARAVAGDRPIDMAWLSRCLGDLLDESTIVVNEYDLDVTQTCFSAPGSYFASSPAAGLGWGLGAALGAKLAAPEKTVICAVGDGAYIFGSPTAAHFVSRAYNLPILVVIFNNRAWNAVKRATRSYAPDGWAVRTGAMPMSDLEPAPDYELICQASGGHGERVEDPAELHDALGRALRVVREERRQALLNVICKKP
jgi:acetolactate synthase-1/2/3 large subunit